MRKLYAFTIKTNYLSLKNSNMKGYKFIIASLATVCCLSSCLDEEPLYTQNNEIVFSSSTNAELALLGCYSYLAYTGVYGQHWQENPIGGSGFGWSQRNGDDLDGLTSLQILSSNGQLTYTWNGMYKVISEVNAFLENLDKSGLSDDVKRQYGGEAKSIRALAYYGLVSLFGDVPLKVKASTSEGISVERSSVEVVLKQAELPDIRFHDLRHTFATHALTSGVDVKTLSGILGHTRAAFTLDTYTHTTGDMQKRAAEIVEEFLIDIFGEELKPWEESEKMAKAPSG